MKTYKIRHTPSGRYYTRGGMLANDGDLFRMKTGAKINLMGARNQFATKYHPSEFKIVEYEMVETTEQPFKSE